MLVEIPVESEFHDNIVAFWQPGQPLAPGVRHDFAYELSLGFAPGDNDPAAQVRQFVSHDRTGGLGPRQ